MLSERAIKWLTAVGWTEDYRWHGGAYLAVKLSEFGHQPNLAALQFCELYGGLAWHRLNPMQPNAGSLMCHTDALSAAESIPVKSIDAGIELAGSGLCPIGGDGYGYYHLAMDEEGAIYAMAADTQEWREFSYSAEDYFNNGADFLREGLLKPGAFIRQTRRRPVE